MTYDQMAVRLLLKGDEAGLRRLAKQAKAQMENRVKCPECGDRGPHEDNGGKGEELTYLCRKCHAHFDAYPG